MRSGPMKLSKVPSSSLQSQALSLLEQISSEYRGVRSYTAGAFSAGPVVWCAVNSEQFVTDISPGVGNEIHAHRMPNLLK